MALSKEDLQAISDLMDAKLEPIQEDLQAISDLMDAKLEPIQADITEIKDSLEEVRGATNALAAWADNVSIITQIKFPVDKVKNG